MSGVRAGTAGARAPGVATPTAPAAATGAGLGEWLLNAAPIVANVAALLLLTGWHWDISWHRSIGRDTVFTPPHVLVYLALALSAAYDAGLILAFTFGRARALPAITVFGFRGPSGAFVTLWGLLLQGAAIVFDLWWHEAYGLDLSVFSPPHYAIMIGTFPFALGHLLLLARVARDGTARAGGAAPPRLRACVPLLAFAALCMATQLVGIDPVYGPAAYITHATILSLCLSVPATLALADALTGSRWAGSIVALVHAGFIILLMQVFQLMPATPRFGPVFHHLDRLLPPAFPAPVIVPALAIAIALPSVARRFHRLGLDVLIAGLAFTASLWIASAGQAALMASPAGDNRLLGGHLPPAAFAEAHLPVSTIGMDAPSLTVLVAATILAGIATLVGHRAGTWLRELRR